MDHATIKKLEEIQRYLIENPSAREKLGFCPVCNSNIKNRPVAIYGELVRTLVRVYLWTLDKGCKTFEMKEVKSLMGKNEYARFGDLVRFGGILYRPKQENGKTRKALYGINNARMQKFIDGEIAIPMQIVINQINNQKTVQRESKIGEFPELQDLLDKNGLYITHLQL